MKTKTLVEPRFDRPEVRAWLATIEGLAALPGAEILHDARNRITAARVPLADGNGFDLAVKEFRPRGLHRLRTLVGRSKAERSARGAAWLAAAGLRTPAVAAVIERRRRGTVEKAWFVAERIRNAVEIRSLFRELAGPELTPLLAALARDLRAAHEAGLLHRDLSDGNILVGRGPDGAYLFHFLDTNRVRRKRRLGPTARAKNLIRLGVPAASRPEFLGFYAGPGGPDPAFVRRYEKSKASFERWLRFKKKARLRQWARRLKLQ
jgi:tRNA A-37 threonylcarbamoyl transferase component Bud32